MKTNLFVIAFMVFFVGKIFAQNCSAPSTGFSPINDLGKGISPVTGLMGGLYPNGSNYLPAAHKAAGLQMASQIQCLDANGNPDPVNGKVVWLSIGMSNTTMEAQQFIKQANAFSGKNPKLKLVDGAQGGQTAQIVATPGNQNYPNFWNTVSSRLSTAGVTAKQVQVVWFKEANVAGTTPIRIYHDSLVVQIKRCMNEIKTRFPNVKLCYLASRISARYASSTLNPEPYSYWTGWAVKKVIEDQIKGDAKLAYSGSATKSPWLSWGIYLWSDGNIPQSTNPNVFYTCPTDFQSDGTHPSLTVGGGAEKVGALLLNFFSTDSTATSWFLAAGGNTTGMKNENPDHSLNIYPNPFSLSTTFQADKYFKNATLTVYNCFGQAAKELKNISGQTITLYRDNLPGGIYFLRLTQDHETMTTSKLIITD